ncbi:carbohydrate kinase family protein [Micromonospora sp. WMMD558]|uniref:carbohydrate kinase family protein n=1 Tax=Micromonospora sp. WMMD558 TaxID=3403462 RepID=UPI003BF57209
MRFPGRFAEQLLAEQLHRVSLSFLVDDLVVRRGGVAANIAYGLGRLGLRPVLLGAAGADFDDYRSWLERHGVDCDSVHISADAHTARFVCTTDADECQIASFYPGAMAEGDRVEIAAAAARRNGLDLVLVAADDPAAMLRHAARCRELGLPFAADPSQQLALLSGEQVRQFVDGAEFLLTNEYEKDLLEVKTGLTAAEVRHRVRVQVTTLGAKGVRITGRDTPTVEVPAVPVTSVADPTGGGDAFRSGFFAALSWGLGLERAGQVGNAVAAFAVEAVGPQEYHLDHDRLGDRLARAYGDRCADEVAAAWTAPPALAARAG